MFPGIGTLLNVLTIIFGSVIGIFIGEKLRDKTRSLITDVLGMVTILGAAAAIIPLFQERYDLVVLKEFAKSDLLAPLFTVLESSAFQTAVAALPGYDVSGMGNLILED